MATFKCKMCGGNIEFSEGATVGICDSCETKQTLPRLSDDRRMNLYDRANHFRRNNDFDKAITVYEQILTEDTTDAEAYWSLVLCRYGIEYVEDPTTKRRVPTVNRTQFTSIFDDDNYKSALKYADTIQRTLYINEATVINDIQKEMLAISEREEPFDVFICYKETDSNGRRTPDSVLANELYYQLTQENFKVFFSRITLEDKLGTAYEPYIFAALNSARVMVVLGTKKEFFNAVWVKNEWSRYLSLIKNSAGKKTLIPAYRDMDPYDLPDEFSHLQALDMSKLGFMSDLVRGIKKLTNKNDMRAISAAYKGPTVNSLSGDVTQLLRRAFVSLEYSEWDEANKAIDKVLDIAPENPQAYLAKLMADLRVNKQEDLANCKSSFENNSNYRRAVRFGDEKLIGELKQSLDRINTRIEFGNKAQIYNNALDLCKKITCTEDVNKALSLFESIKGFQKSDEMIDWCKNKLAKCTTLDTTYNDAFREEQAGMGFFIKHEQHTATLTDAHDASEMLASAMSKYQRVEDWRDSKQRIQQIRMHLSNIANTTTELQNIERIQKQQQWLAKQKILGIIVCLFGTIILFTDGNIALGVFFIIIGFLLARAAS